MNEQLECFVGKMRETGLLHETDPSPSSPKLEVSLYDDYESSLPLEPDFMANSPLTGLEKVIVCSLTSSLFIAPSLPSTLRDTTKGVLHLLFSSPLPLAQCTGLEIRESLVGDTSCVEDDSLDWLGEFALLEPSFKEYYSHDVRVGAAPSIEHTDQIHTELLDLVPISFPFLPTTPSHLHAFQESLGDISGLHPSFDPYCAYLADFA